MKKTQTGPQLDHNETERTSVSQNQTKMDKNEIKRPNIETKIETGINQNESRKKRKIIGSGVQKATAVECWLIALIATLFTLDQHLHGHLSTSWSIVSYSIDTYISWLTIDQLSIKC